LYDAKESSLAQQMAAPQKQSTASPSWALPFFGVLAMFSFVAFGAFRARRGRRLTRDVQIMEPLSQEADSELENGLE